MSSLRPIEKQRFEDLFGMASGYVLNFSDRTFAEFFRQTISTNIYDDRYAFNGHSKAKRLRAFWEIDDDPAVGKILEGLLEIWRYSHEPGKDERADASYIQCCKIAERLLGRKLQEESEDEFIKRDFGSISLSSLGLDPAVENILSLRIKEATDCATAGASLAAIFMCGSILEGLLLNLALNHPAEFNQAISSPKQKDNGKPKAFHDWSLAALIDVSHELGFLRLDVKKFGHALRDFRNYVHPYEQMASKFTPDSHTANMCLQVLRAAVAGLKAKHQQR